MATDDLLQFYHRANAEPDLRAEAMGALEAGPGAVVALGAREGFSFTEAEVETALETMQLDGELSDDDLDLVAGGTAPKQTAFA